MHVCDFEHFLLVQVCGRMNAHVISVCVFNCALVRVFCLFVCVCVCVGVCGLVCVWACVCVGLCVLFVCAKNGRKICHGLSHGKGQKIPQSLEFMIWL